MTELELRALVREAIARRSAAPPPEPERAVSVRPHPSHALVAVPAGADGDGLCIIEPTVTCSHCGYCKSLGH